MVSFRDSSCTGKQRHDSKHKAKAHLKSLAKSLGVPNHKFSVYPCVYCHGFHVGGARPDIEESDREIERYAEVSA